MKSDETSMSKLAPSSEPRVRERKQATGNWNPDWEPFAKLDPAWTEKVIAMSIAPAVSGALDPKTIELIGIALDVSCTHMFAPGVRRHIQRALKAGATREEIIAVLEPRRAQRASPPRRTTEFHEAVAGLGPDGRLA